MFNEQAALDKVLGKLQRTTARIQDTVPYRTKNGVYEDLSEDIAWWTNGFYPGILWLAYQKTQNPDFAAYANGVEKKLDKALNGFFGLHHDVGFMWELSAVANYRLTGNEDSLRRGYIAASVLASRFNQAGSFIRAWNDWGTTSTAGWAIIDCMMNLGILYWASEHSKDPRFSHIAKAHAETVMKNFIYEDGSSKHIVEFNPETGEYITNQRGQGYSKESAWSRGNAWALYGFALSAKYTKRNDFLNTSKKIANFFISHLPEDHVPFADFKAPADINIDKDSSAAACAASGLLILARILDDENEKVFYKNKAISIIASLYNNYTDWEGDEAFITRGCTAFHDTGKGKYGSNQTSLIYGDYFFLEALMQLNGFEELF